MIRARGGRLVLQQLHYPDELRAPDEIPIDDAEVKDAEVQLALALIEQTTSPGFHPEQYEDTVKRRVLEAIARKVEGQEIHAAAPVEPQAQVIDLLEALKASLAREPAAKAAAAPAPASPDAAAPVPAPAATAQERKPARSARPAPAAERPKAKATPRR
jgi:DNA end-binding protein Ku